MLSDLQFKNTENMFQRVYSSLAELLLILIKQNNILPTDFQRINQQMKPTLTRPFNWNLPYQIIAFAVILSVSGTATAMECDEIKSAISDAVNGFASFKGEERVLPDLSDVVVIWDCKNDLVENADNCGVYHFLQQDEISLSVHWCVPLVEFSETHEATKNKLQNCIGQQPTEGDPSLEWQSAAYNWETETAKVRMIVEEPCIVMSDGEYSYMDEDKTGFAVEFSRP